MKTNNKNIQMYKGVAYLCDGLDNAPLKLGDSIRKINSEEGDGHVDGSTGMILGSMSEPIEVKESGLPPQYMYAVIWDDTLNVVISTISNKLEKINGN